MSTVVDWTDAPSIPPSSVFTEVVVKYNFDVDGPTIVGENALSLGRTIPAGSLITRNYINIIEIPVGPTTMALGVGITSPTDVTNVKNITSWPWNGVGLSVMQHQVSRLPVDKDSVILTCTDNPTSAGHFQLIIEWLIPPFQ